MHSEVTSTPLNQRAYDDYRLAVIGFSNCELIIYCILYGVNFVLTVVHHLVGYDYPIFFRLAASIPMLGVCVHVLYNVTFGNKVSSGFNKEESTLNTFVKYFWTDKETELPAPDNNKVQRYIDGYFKRRKVLVVALKYTVILSTTGICLTFIEGVNGLFMGEWVYVLINFSMVAVLVSLIFLMCGRLWYVAPIIAIYLSKTLAGIFYTVIIYRGTALMPGEIFDNLGTLLITTGGQPLKYPFPLLSWGDLVGSILFTAVIMSVILYRTLSGRRGDCYAVVSEEFSRERFLALRGPMNIRKEALAVLLGGAMITVTALQSGIAVGAWEYAYSQAPKGILFSFVRMLGVYKLEEPEGYDLYKDEVGKYSYEGDKVLTGGAGADGGRTTGDSQVVKPNVFIIMNESFSDVNAYLDIETTAEVLPFLGQVREEEYVESGFVVAPYVGGMTCNTEFEAITGLSTSFLPFMVSPYNNLSAPLTSFVDYFNERGYKSVYLHPFWGSAWGREDALTNIAFDDVYFGGAFGEGDGKGESWFGDTTSESNLGAFGSTDEVEYVRSFISDRENYKKLLSIVKDTEEPVFIYNTTVQNHGFYTEDVRGGLEYDIELRTTLSDKGVQGALTQYINLINLSDQALRELMQQLDELDEPVVVCFFGDHIPPLEFNESNLLLPFSRSVDRSSDENILKQLWLTRTPYIIWSNEKHRGLTGGRQASKGEIFSTNYLLRHVIDYIGLPQPSFGNFLKGLEAHYPIISTIEGVEGDELGAEEFDKYAAFNYQQYSISRKK